MPVTFASSVKSDTAAYIVIYNMLYFQTAAFLNANFSLENSEYFESLNRF